LYELKQIIFCRRYSMEHPGYFQCFLLCTYLTKQTVFLSVFLMYQMFLMFYRIYLFCLFQE